METVFTLPLALFALVQILIAILLLAPSGLSLPIAQLISKARKGTAAKSILNTIQILFLALFISCMSELIKGADRVKHGDVRCPCHGALPSLLNVCLPIRPSPKERRAFDHRLHALSAQLLPVRPEPSSAAAERRSGRGEAGARLEC